jgi:hypothetical protein
MTAVRAVLRLDFVDCRLKVALERRASAERKGSFAHLTW